MTRIGWRVLLAAALLMPLSAALAGGPKYKPRIAGPWQPLFRPEKAGNYLNDHCLYQDPKGDWHLVGITALHSPRFGTGEYWFAHGVTSSLTTPAPKTSTTSTPSNSSDASRDCTRADS